MPCISPPEPDLAALLRYADGEADPDTSAHLARCAHCRGRADALVSEDRRLSDALFRSQCPSTDELMDYSDHSLDRARAAELEPHLAHCPHCQRDVADFAVFMALPDMLPAAVPAAASAAPTPSRLGELIGGFRLLVATLVSGQGGLAGGLAPAYAGAGLRGGGGEGVYAVEAEDIQITVAVEPDDAQRGRRIVAGTLAGLPAAEAQGSPVWLTAGEAGEEIVAHAAVGARGYFELHGVAPGHYALTLRLPDRAVQIPDLEV